MDRMRVLGMIVWLWVGLAASGLGLAAEIQLNNREFNAYEQQGNAVYPMVWMRNLLEGEDPAVGALRTFQRWTRIPVGQTTSVFTGDQLLKTGAGILHSITCAGSDATATAGTIDIRDNTAAGSGNILWQLDVQAVAYTQPMTVELDVPFAVGAFLDFTTTGDMKCSGAWQ